MLPPYTGYAHGHNSGELSISVRTPPHTHTSACTRAHPHMRMHTRARTHTPTYTHARAHTHLPCAVEPLPQGLRGPRRHRRENRRTQSHRYTHTRTHKHTHTHTHTHVHNTCKYTRGSLLQENHTRSHVGMNCIHSWSYCLGHMREEQESEYVTQTQCASTC